MPSTIAVFWIEQWNDSSIRIQIYCLKSEDAILLERSKASSRFHCFSTSHLNETPLNAFVSKRSWNRRINEHKIQNYIQNLLFIYIK